MKRLTLEATMDNLDVAVDFVVAEAESVGLDKFLVNRVRLASEEIFVNIIHYAYPGSTGAMEIACGPHPERKGLQIVVSDAGVPFDPLSCAPADTTRLPMEDRSIGGLGIHMVRTIMDDMKYRREGNQNILTLVKYLET